MLSKTFISQAYNTKGNELCKFVRAEVMECIEEYEMTGKCTEEKYNEIVKNTMQRIKNIIQPIIEVEVEHL